MSSIIERVSAIANSIGDSPKGDTRDSKTGSDPDLNWRRVYTRGLLVTDLAVLAITTILADLARFGSGASVEAGGPINISYTVLGAVVVVMWWLVLQLFRTRDVAVLGEGTEEYRRITRATVLMFGWLAILSLVFKWDMSRGYLAIAFPLGLTGLLIGRKVWRVWLRRKRIAGLATSRVLVVGGTETAQEIMSWFLKHRGAGYVVTGVWVPDQSEHQDSDTLGIHGPGHGYKSHPPQCCEAV